MLKGRRMVFASGALVCALVFTATTVPPKAAESAEEGTPIEAVLSEIQKALNGAQAEVRNLAIPPLESVTMTLQTEFSKKSDGTFKFLIFSFGKKWERTRSQEIVITLKPPKPQAPGKDTEKAPSLARELQQAIVEAARGVHAARNGTPPLESVKLEAEISFVVEKSKNLGVSFEIVPVSAEMSGNLTEKALQKIRVNFEKEKEADAKTRP